MPSELTLLRKLAENARVMRLTEAADPAFPAALKTFDDSLVDALKAGHLDRTFDLAEHLLRQLQWSGATFGPGPRTKGVIDHIRKELIEIESDPLDLKEWIDATILSLDGAWRALAASGMPEVAIPGRIIAALVAKQAKNERRTWPDWRTADPDKAIEHDRSGEITEPVRFDSGEIDILPCTHPPGCLKCQWCGFDALKDWPTDPANGRLLCTPERPRPAYAPGSWAHAGAIVMHAGDYSDHKACRDCGADWREELPE